MDPQLEKSPGLALPQPSVEQGGVAKGDFQGTYPTPEAASAAVEMAPVPAVPIVTTVMPSGAPQAVPQIPLQSAASTRSTNADDDSDDRFFFGDDFLAKFRHKTNERSFL